MHVHYLQEEAAQVVRGRLGYQLLGGEPQFAGPGELVVWPAGYRAQGWNAGEDELHMTGWCSPPDNIEFFLRTLFASTKANGGVRPGLFDAAFLVTRYRTEFAMLELPAAVRHVLMAVAYVLVTCSADKKFADAPAPISRIESDGCIDQLGRHLRRVHALWRAVLSRHEPAKPFEWTPAAVSRIAIPTEADLRWLTQALREDEPYPFGKKWFVSQIVSHSASLGEELLGPMLDAAVDEIDPSYNRLFIEPCMQAFGPRRVNEYFAGLESGTDFRKAGAAQALYCSTGVSRRHTRVAQSLRDA